MRIVHANVFHDNKQIQKDFETLRQINPVVLALNEAYNYIPLARNVQGYQCYVSKVHDRGQQDCPTLLRNDAKMTDWGTIKATKAVRPIKIAPARYVTWIEFNWHDQKWLHINTHLDAALQDRSTGKPLVHTARVREAIKHMRLIAQMIRKGKKEGRNVLVSGDFNYRIYLKAKAFALWYYSPQRMFQRAKMKWVNDGLDYVGFLHTFKVDKKSIIPASHTGSDHPWIVLDLSRI